jgi:hypothetical protein
VKVDVVDGVEGTIGIEFKSVVGAAAKVATEPEGSEPEAWTTEGPETKC